MASSTSYFGFHGGAAIIINAVSRKKIFLQINSNITTQISIDLLSIDLLSIDLLSIDNFDTVISKMLLNLNNITYHKSIGTNFGGIIHTFLTN